MPESSGACWCRFWRRVPEGSGEFRREAGSGRFLKVPAYAGVGSGDGFRRVPAYAGVGSGGRFPKVPGSSGVKWCRSGSRGQFRRLRGILEGSTLCWRRLAQKVLERSGGGEFRRVLV